MEIEFNQSNMKLSEMKESKIKIEEELGMTLED